MFETIVIVAILGFVVWAFFTPQGKAKIAEIQAEEAQKKEDKLHQKAWKNKYGEYLVLTHDATDHYIYIDDIVQRQSDWVVLATDAVSHNQKTIAVNDILQMQSKTSPKYFNFSNDIVNELHQHLGKMVSNSDPSSYRSNEYDSTDDQHTDTPPPIPQNIEPRQRVPKEEASHTMVYVDSKGSLSEREINLRGVEAKNGKLYVNAYCFKRKRLRTFVAKNIISLRDYATDKTFTDEDEIYNELLAWITTTQPHT
jgi:hypothetical protein